MSLSTPDYCLSRYRALRRATREVMIGSIGVGGHNPLRLQSMTTSDTQDVAATVQQCINLAEVGCEIIRITAPNKPAAAALREIHQQFRAAGFSQPLVADIHFIPAAAMEAIEHVEKVRINPGNYADKKRFSERDYTDAEYDSELQRLHDAVSPLIKRAKELGRALRIGTNHGSLSDRLMNRYGDTPLGMVESALEFIRICESHGFKDLVLSMKSSNPKVMIEAYRLAVAKMDAEDMHYPLHLGVTEAGEGEDARIKSAIGIGSLLQDGLGDTLRVSLTEDPWYEVPVARELAQRAENLWKEFSSSPPLTSAAKDQIDPYNYTRRPIADISLNEKCPVNNDNPPRVIVPATLPLADYPAIVKEVLEAHSKQKEVRAEGLLVQFSGAADLPALQALGKALSQNVNALFVETTDACTTADFAALQWGLPCRLVFVRRITNTTQDLAAWVSLAQQHQALLALNAHAGAINALAEELQKIPPARLIYTSTQTLPGHHPVGSYRALVAALQRHGLTSPLWIRNSKETAAGPLDTFQGRLMEAAMLSGSLFCDGLGDLISVETDPTFGKALVLAYNILQGARMRSSKTEYVACPSCGRTLFDIQSTTQRIKARTGHLKGVTIAVMGCIVNGPGEMADADFGYVGGAPAKINLYVRKDCVKFNIPQTEAVERLVDLIKEHGKWVEPDAPEET